MTQADQLATSAIAVAVIATAIAVYALLQARKARKMMTIYRGVGSETDILEAAAAHALRNEELNTQIQRLRHQLAIAQRDISEALRHMAVVRFNAVQDMGGQISFSAAMLDDEGNGIVLTSIQAHSQGRVYAKSVIAGTSEYPLTPEEKQAIAAARPQNTK
ncbi:MAG: hypothetical protein RL441_87 [Actinomycetota bacterium]